MRKAELIYVILYVKSICYTGNRNFNLYFNLKTIKRIKKTLKNLNKCIDNNGYVKNNKKEALS